MRVLFIHGAGATSSIWRLQTVHFNDSAAVELPGHPEGSGMSTIEEYAEYVKHHFFRDDRTFPVVVGHSMGGAIAIEVALRLQTHLRGLVLVGTGARLRVREEFLSRIREDYAAAARMLASWSVSNSASPILVDRIKEDLMKIKPEVTLGDFTACNEFDRMGTVAEITCPTLVLCGAEDRMTPVKYSQYLYEKIKGSKLVIVQGAGHGVMLEKHREFNQALDDFLVSR